MKSDKIERQILEQEYHENVKRFNKFGNLIKLYLSDVLYKNGIPYMEIQTRVKDFDSFLNKVKMGRESGKYDRPFEQIEDLCGVRVICVFRLDLDKVINCIESLFEASPPDDKEQKRNTDEFNYRSIHTIVELKESHCNSSVFYQELKGLKAEIQVRTIGMHAWAEVSHKLDYKKDSTIPREPKRQLIQASARLEAIDKTFDDIYQYFGQN